MIIEKLRLIFINVFSMYEMLVFYETCLIKISENIVKYDELHYIN